MYSELLEELMNSRKKYYVADCIDAEQAIGYTHDQVSEMLSESIELTPTLFSEMCEVLDEHQEIPNASYGYSEDDDVAWVYDPENDRHFFYR